MNLDEILSGLADALELERELGVREIEIDRELLKDAAPVGAAPVDAVSHRVTQGKDLPSSDAERIPRLREDESPRLREELPLVFLHDRALSAGGVEMMAKIVTAMHQTPETAPILFMGPRPAARVTVVLGFRALKHWFPDSAGAPGQWIEPDGLKNVLVTYSPEYILRFGVQSPAVKKLKLEMWTSLKAAMQRLR